MAGRQTRWSASPRKALVRSQPQQTRLGASDEKMVVESPSNAAGLRISDRDLLEPWTFRQRSASKGVNVAWSTRYAIRRCRGWWECVSSTQRAGVVGRCRGGNRAGHTELAGPTPTETRRMPSEVLSVPRCRYYFDENIQISCPGRTVRDHCCSAAHRAVPSRFGRGRARLGPMFG